jgi:DNA-binding transcriptional LysR family regulator
MFAGGPRFDRAFALRGLAPEVALSALDSDVIKSYVALGLGVGIISSRAFRVGKEEGLVALDCGTSFRRRPRASPTSAGRTCAATPWSSSGSSRPTCAPRT